MCKQMEEHYTYVGYTGVAILWLCCGYVGSEGWARRWTRGGGVRAVLAVQN